MKTVLQLMPEILAALRSPGPNASLVADLEKAMEHSPLPPIDGDLINILGRPNFTCGPIAVMLRGLGWEIERKAEVEQATVLHWLLGLYLVNSKTWPDDAGAYLQLQLKKERPE